MEKIDEFDLLLYIYKETEIKNRVVNFTKIKHDYLRKNCSPESILQASSYLDHMYDQGMLDPKWTKHNGKYSYCYFVDEDFLGFTQALYNFTQKKQISQDKAPQF